MLCAGHCIPNTALQCIRKPDEAPTKCVCVCVCVQYKTFERQQQAQEEAERRQPKLEEQVSFPASLPRVMPNLLACTRIPTHWDQHGQEDMLLEKQMDSKQHVEHDVLAEVTQSESLQNVNKPSSIENVNKQSSKRPQEY
jgi:hypothetical protein